MAALQTCRACRSPALVGTHYCAACLLTPAFQSSDEPVSLPVSLEPGSRVDRFEIVEILGVGGFSEVYSVSDCRSPNRPLLAMKVMRMGLNSAEFLSRFEQEHQVLRRLEDPGIVRVFELGICDDGRPYFVMELIDGLRITDFCQAEELSLESRVELFVDVCRTVHHAHQKGIIHRDLKPANILVSEHEGKSIPYVIDFGLAKAVECWNSPNASEPSGGFVTQLGIAMGTPGYISPEQVEGSEDTDTLSDVFSLGVVLYELIAQVPPWPHETWKQIPHTKWSNYKSENAPPKASIQNGLYPIGRRIDVDLDTICNKALATDRRQRYESVSQLATDLSHWLIGDAISARPPSLSYRVSKLMSRYRWQSATLIASLATCLLATLFGVTLAIRERRYSTKLMTERVAAIDAKLEANELRELAIHERTVAERVAYASSIKLATLQIANGQPYLAQNNLNSTLPSLRGWEWNYLERLTPRPVLSMATGLDEPVSLGVSPDGAFVAVCDGRSITRLNLKLATASPIPGKIEPRVQHVAISDDGQYVATLAHQATSSFIKVYRYGQVDETGESAHLTLVWSRQVHPDSSLKFEFGADKPVLIVAEGNGSEPVQGTAYRLSAATGDVLASIDLKRWKLADKGLVVGNEFAVFRCSFDRLAVVRLPDFTIAGYIYGQPNTIIEDFELNEEETHVVFAQFGAVYQAKWNQPGSNVVDILPDEKLKGRFEVDNQFGVIHRLNLSPDKRWMALTDTHCIVEGSAPVPLPIRSETQLVSLLNGTYATILPHGLFEIRREIQELEDCRFEGRSVGPSPEGRRVAAAPSSNYCLFQTWSRQNIYRSSLLTETEPDVLTRPENKRLEWSRLPAFHPDGTAIVAESSNAGDQPSDQSITTLAALHWEGEKTHSVPLPVRSIPWSAAASPDGKTLYVGTMQGISALDWSSRGLQREWTISGGPFVVMPMADNSGVFAVGIDHVIHSLRVDTAAVASGSIIEDGPGLIPAHSDYFAAEQVLAISDSGWIRIFSLGNTHKEIGRVPAKAGVTAIRFSADGQRLAIATPNRKITVWDWKGNHPLMELGTRGTCSSIDFSRDGRWLINTDFHPTLTIR